MLILLGLAVTCCAILLVFVRNDLRTIYKLIHINNSKDDSYSILLRLSNMEKTFGSLIAEIKKFQEQTKTKEPKSLSTPEEPKKASAKPKSWNSAEQRKKASEKMKKWRADNRKRERKDSPPELFKPESFENPQKSA